MADSDAMIGIAIELQKLSDTVVANNYTEVLPILDDMVTVLSATYYKFDSDQLAVMQGLNYWLQGQIDSSEVVRDDLLVYLEEFTKVGTL